MGYFYEDWKEKKMFVENSDGQFVMNFGEAEKSMIDTAFGTNPRSATLDDVRELVKVSIFGAR